MNFKEKLNQEKNDFVINLKEFPSLVDHAFQDMIVLPGSTYLEMASVIFERYYKKLPDIIKNVNFENLILLSDVDTRITYKFVETSDNLKEIQFTENSVGKNNSYNSVTTKLFVGSSIEKYEQKKIDFNVNEFKNNSNQKIESDDFYKKLFENGNQYGKHFQNIKEIWFSNGRSLAKLLNPINPNANSNDIFLNPSLVDSFTQLLSTLSESKGRTFILNSIKEIKILNYKFPEEIWCIASLLNSDEKDENEFEGNLQIFDSTGLVYLELNGVKFKYLEKFQAQDKTLEKEKYPVYISSTFTADPLEDSLKFWDNYFDLSFDIQFAPYNQVFQELLNPQSLLSTNQNGYNVILLGLEDWTRKDHSLISKLSVEAKEKLLFDKSRYTLPNHLEIAHLNKYETEYVYKEIFVDKCYLKHGITLNDSDTIIDIGANIGLFTLFVNQFCKDPEVFSFEPSPVVYNLLKTNSELYGSNVKTFNFGVSDKEKTAKFTFYESSSVFSSFNPDETEDREAIQAVVRNMLKDTTASEDSAIEEYVKELTSERLESKSYECRLISVSDIISENNIKKIDLLKIDAEKSELGIIKGIKDDDWDKIKQIVIEIHDKSRKVLEEIEKILTSKGFSIEVEEEKMLKESGLFNVFARKNNSSNDNQFSSNNNKFISEKLSENTNNFVNALQSFNQKSSVPLILAITPRSPIVNSNPSTKNLYDKSASELINKTKNFSNVHTISSETLINNFQSVEYYDPQGDELGHIPYSLKFFSLLGTSLTRKIYSLQHSAYKVIALDCDNTLWKGVCGEDGPKGIQISKGYKFLQQFMVDQIQVGMLICLCSKNNEEDVLDVFEQKDDMILKKNHLISWRINWDYKSINLKSLAAELNLGLDSFIFIDDNPVECAEVKANCPEVLTLQLPQKEDEIPAFLKNIWAFDHLKVTEEDKKRTKMYQENVEREKYQSSALTLKDFLDGLNLHIKISAPGPKQMERVSQLTFRTNQFNFTTLRRSESEILKLIEKDGYQCIIVNVSDRFGDYGLVGLLLFNIINDVIEVDTFLLSCRVLGRGVEHKFLSALGKIATEKNINSIVFKYLETKKNRPALEFIDSFGKEFKSEISGGYRYDFPSEFLMSLKYEPTSSAIESAEVKDVKKEQKSTVKTILNLNDKIQEIGLELNTPTQIYKKVEEFKLSQSIGETANYAAPKTEIEKQLVDIWQKVLSIKQVGLDDNFFEVGGTSLKAVQLIATIKKELEVNISIVTIFECPTVNLLSKKLNELKGNVDTETNFEEQVDRGSRRRKAISRKL